MGLPNYIGLNLKKFNYITYRGVFAILHLVFQEPPRMPRDVSNKEHSIENNEAASTGDIGSWKIRDLQ